MPYPLELLRDGSVTDANFQRLAQDMNPPVPQARVYNSANISHAVSGTEQVVTFDSERFDNGGLHSTSANTSRLTAPITGVYQIGASIRFANNATGYRYIYLRSDGATVLGTDVRNATAGGIVTTITLSVCYQLAATSYVEVVANQTSGGALNMETVSGGLEFWMVRLGGYINQGV